MLWRIFNRMAVVMLFVIATLWFVSELEALYMQDFKQALFSLAMVMLSLFQAIWLEWDYVSNLGGIDVQDIK